MRIRDAFGIYHQLELELKKSSRPLTCVDLFDVPEVRKHADSARRVSDYLGHMYRRGLLGREPVPKTINSQARWGYYWKDRSQVKDLAAQKTEEVMQSLMASTGKILSKPNIEVTDHGGTVIIELPQLTITIRTKS